MYSGGAVEGEVQECAFFPARLAEERDYKYADCHVDTATVLDWQELAFGSSRSHLDFMRLDALSELAVFAFFVQARGRAEAEWCELWRHYQSFDRAVEANGRVEVVTCAAQLHTPGRPQAVLALEGLDLLAWAQADDEHLRSLLRRLWQAGFRSLGCFWNNCSWLGCGSEVSRTASDYGLTAAGESFLLAGLEQGFLLDLAHASAVSFQQLMELARQVGSCGRLWVSHTACDSISHHRRNLTDAELRQLGDNGSIVGIALYPVFLTGTERAELADWASHIDRAVRCAGIDAVALGSDFDGVECLPSGVEGAQSLPQLAAFLEGRGYTYAEVEKIMGGNLRRFLRETLR